MESLCSSCAAQDVGDDFHVAMRMRAEAHARHHEIVVDDAQAAVTHPLRDRNNSRS